MSTLDHSTSKAAKTLINKKNKLKSTIDTTVEELEQEKQTLKNQPMKN